MDWDNTEGGAPAGAAGEDAGDAVDDERGTPSATDPAMDAWTFAAVVAAQADQLVEMAESIRGTVEDVAANLESAGDHWASAMCGDVTEGAVELLAEQIDDIVTHATTVIEHARVLVSLYADEAGQRPGDRRGSAG